jgi:hypothetical protein
MNVRIFWNIDPSANFGGLRLGGQQSLAAVVIKATRSPLNQTAADKKALHAFDES